MGMTSRFEERENLINLLLARRQDHLDWLNELEASIAEGREFTKTTDPHACAFGKWYDSFKATNHSLQHQLKRFDAPHKTIHGMAKLFLDVVKKEGKEAGLKLCKAARENEMQKLFKIFEDVIFVLRQTTREIGLVFQLGHRLVALSVDSTEFVKLFEHDSIEPFKGGLTVPAYITGVYKIDKGSVVVVNEKEILSELAANP